MSDTGVEKWRRCLTSKEMSLNRTLREVGPALVVKEAFSVWFGLSGFCARDEVQNLGQVYEVDGVKCQDSSYQEIME